MRFCFIHWSNCSQCADIFNLTVDTGQGSRICGHFQRKTIVRWIDAFHLEGIVWWMIVGPSFVCRLSHGSFRPQRGLVCRAIKASKRDWKPPCWLASEGSPESSTRSLRCAFPSSDTIASWTSCWFTREMHLIPKAIIWGSSFVVPWYMEIILSLIAAAIWYFNFGKREFSCPPAICRRPPRVVWKGEGGDSLCISVCLRYQVHDIRSSQVARQEWSLQMGRFVNSVLPTYVIRSLPFSFIFRSTGIH